MPERIVFDRGIPEIEARPIGTGIPDTQTGSSGDVHVSAGVHGDRIGEVSASLRVIVSSDPDFMAIRIVLDGRIIEPGFRGSKGAVVLALPGDVDKPGGIDGDRIRGVVSSGARAIVLHRP